MLGNTVVRGKQLGRRKDGGGLPAWKMPYSTRIAVLHSVHFIHKKEKREKETGNTIVLFTESDMMWGYCVGCGWRKLANCAKNISRHTILLIHKK